MRFVLRYSLILIIAFGLVGCGSSGSSSNSDAGSPPPDPQINRAPQVVLANSDQTAEVGTSFSYDATQNGMTFSDPDGDNLTYSLELSNTNGLSINGTMISGTPDVSGTITVTVTATDPGGLSASDLFDVVIISPPAVTEKNVLLIIADDVGQDASSQYNIGTEKPNTPYLDQLASAGVVFENLWVNPVCSPTRSALLTGKYGISTNVFSPGDVHDTAETNVFEELKQGPQTSHYASALIGKWHLGGGRTGPNDAGIDHFAGILGGGVSDYRSWSLNVNGTNTAVTSYTTTEITDQAISWLGDQTEPWFMWVAYNAAHTPFHLPPTDLHDRNLSADQADIDANPLPYYLAAIEAMDSEIGRLLESMSNEERANTTIFFIGDNGSPGRVAQDGPTYRGSKGSLYEGGIRVPMIASSGAVTRQGARETAIINGTDFYATILELTGHNSEAKNNDSQSFVPLLDGSSTATREYIYTDGAEGRHAIRGQRFKLIVNDDGSKELYDLDTDPGESANLIVNASFANELSELELELSKIRDGGWLVNTNNERSGYIVDGTEFVEVNVLDVVDDGTSVTITTNSIPNYQISVTDEVLAVYESRPNSAFANGPILNIGDAVVWGQDVGMNSSCPDGGDGWWPGSGGSCALSEMAKTWSFPSSPTPSTMECDTGLGPVGMWVNGVPIYNWSDATSHNDEDVWHRFAEPFRSAGMDMCNGHSNGNGQYHHHSYNACLRQMVSDQGNRHSPIYGYAGDGYPIHGPYHSNGQLTKSCWKTRDYSATSETGCGVEGARTCKLVDEEDVSQGIETVLSGPSTFDVISFFQNGNGPARTGIFYEDFYYDDSCSAQGDEFLDEHNGHNHDRIGYHYHTSVDDNLVPVFPLTHGPDYYGSIDNSSFRCFRSNF